MLASRSKRSLAPAIGICLAVTLGSSGALADGAWDRGTPFALGAESCGQYLTDVASDQTLQRLYDAWLSGYMKIVAEQYEGYTLIAETDIIGASAWVKNYCRQREADSYLTAAVRLMAERERSRPGEMDPRTAPPSLDRQSSRL